jgi:hypothetical protein
MTVDTLPPPLATPSGTGFEQLTAAEVAEAILRQEDEEVLRLMDQREQEEGTRNADFIDRQIAAAQEVGSMAMRFADSGSVATGEDLIVLLSGQGSKLRYAGQDRFVEGTKLADRGYRFTLAERLTRLGSMGVGDLMVPPEAHDERPQTLAEKHPNRPPVEILYDLAPHGTSEDFEDFPARLAESDVYIVEGGGQDALIKAKVLQEIANLNPEHQSPTLIDDYIEEHGLQGSQTEVVIRALYGTRKAVGSFDVKGEDLQLGKDAIQAYKDMVPDYSKQDFDSTVADFSAKVRKVAELQRKRETVMVGNVEAELERIIAEHPELLDKDKIRVYAPMGMAHGTLVRDLKASTLGLDVDSNIPDESDFTHREELMRYFMAGGTEPSHDLEMRAYASDVIEQNMLKVLQPMGVRTADLLAYVRTAVGGLNESDMKYLYRNEKVDPMTPDRMDSFLRGRGLPPLPLSPNELSKTVARIREARAPQQG